jgi:hypothetical protein
LYQPCRELFQADVVELAPLLGEKAEQILIARCAIATSKFASICLILHKVLNDLTRGLPGSWGGRIVKVSVDVKGVLMGFGVVLDPGSEWLKKYPFPHILASILSASEGLVYKDKDYRELFTIGEMNPPPNAYYKKHPIVWPYETYGENMKFFRRAMIRERNTYRPHASYGLLRMVSELQEN